MSDRRRLMMSVRAGGELVFHAPLIDDLLDHVSGRKLTVPDTEWSDDNEFYDDGYLLRQSRLHLTDLDLPFGSDPCTMMIRIRPIDWGVEDEWNFLDFFGYGRPEMAAARLMAGNPFRLGAHLFEADWNYDGEVHVGEDRLYHVAMTVSESGVGMYLDGEYLGGDDELIPKTQAGELSIGGTVYGDSDVRLFGIVRDARIYNGVLSAQEIADIAAEI